MKRTTLLSIFVTIGMIGFSQKKSDMETQLAQQSATIDSLNASLGAMSSILDSVNIELDEFRGMHKAIVDKVLLRDFKPSEMEAIIDSLHANRDSSFTASIELWQDSVASLNAQIETLNASAASEEQKESMAAELKMLKGLLDEGILTPEEFDARKTKVLEKWQ